MTYSGTVSAAFEGTLIGIPSVAVSQEIETGFTFDAAADIRGPARARCSSSIR